MRSKLLQSCLKTADDVEFEKALEQNLQQEIEAVVGSARKTAGPVGIVLSDQNNQVFEAQVDSKALARMLVRFSGEELSHRVWDICNIIKSIDVGREQELISADYLYFDWSNPDECKRELTVELEKLGSKQAQDAVNEELLKPQEDYRLDREWENPYANKENEQNSKVTTMKRRSDMLKRHAEMQQHKEPKKLPPRKDLRKHIDDENQAEIKNDPDLKKDASETVLASPPPDWSKEMTVEKALDTLEFNEDAKDVRNTLHELHVEKWNKLEKIWKLLPGEIQKAFEKAHGTITKRPERVPYGGAVFARRKRATELWQREFPGFKGTIPALPPGFEDNSWHNDVCPSFYNDNLGLALFIAEDDPADREFGEGADKYTLNAYSGTLDAGDVQLSDTDFFQTNDFNEILDRINKAKPKTSADVSKWIRAVDAEIEALDDEEAGGDLHDIMNQLMQNAKVPKEHQKQVAQHFGVHVAAKIPATIRVDYEGDLPGDRGIIVDVEDYDFSGGYSAAPNRSGHPDNWDDGDYEPPDLEYLSLSIWVSPEGDDGSWNPDPEKPTYQYEYKAGTKSAPSTSTEVPGDVHNFIFEEVVPSLEESYMEDQSSGYDYDPPDYDPPDYD